MNDSYDSYLWLLAEKEVLFGVIAVNCLVLLVKLATEQCTDCPSEIPGLVASMKKHKLKVSLQLKNCVYCAETMYHIQLCWINCFDVIPELI